VVPGDAAVASAHGAPTESEAEVVVPVHDAGKREGGKARSHRDGGQCEQGNASAAELSLSDRLALPGHGGRISTSHKRERGRARSRARLPRP
jgi:hypothetical protein